MRVRLLKIKYLTQANMARYITFVICFLWSTSMTITDNSSSRIDLVIGGFFGVNITDGGWSTATAIPAFEMALDHVNSDPNVLTNYKLKYVWRDSKVRKMPYKIERNKFNALAQIMHFWNIARIFQKTPRVLTRLSKSRLCFSKNDIHSGV